MSTTNGGVEPGPAVSPYLRGHPSRDNAECLSDVRDYAARQASKPVAVMCCEGACLRR